MKTPKTNKQPKAKISLASAMLLGVSACPLHQKTPHGIRFVSMTQLSLARHYGGIFYNGEEYTYLPATDELIRRDVHKWARKRMEIGKHITPKETALLF